MASASKNIFLSENSVVYSYLVNAETELAGGTNPIHLPSIDFDTIQATFGRKITSGIVADIYEVKDCSPARVYKVIPRHSFVNGDEIVITKIAGELNVAPTFYSAFLVKQKINYVVIEMDDAGKSLEKWTEILAENQKTHENTEKGRRFHEMVKKILSPYSNSATTENSRADKVSIGQAITMLYTNEETFYYELFYKIKILAEKHIAYVDAHIGNILHNHSTNNDLHLIDFDAADLTPDTPTAAEKSILGSSYNKAHFIRFKELSKSPASKELIQWFVVQIKKTRLNHEPTLT
jgi:hypothetical protein